MSNREPWFRSLFKRRRTQAQERPVGKRPASSYGPYEMPPGTHPKVAEWVREQERAAGEPDSHDSSEQS